MTGSAVSYGPSTIAWEAFDRLVMGLIDEERANLSCEVGGGANPTLPMDFVEKRGIDYVIMDISEYELAKAPDRYVKVCRDIQQPDSKAEGRYDLIFSKMLAEHVRRGEDFHRNVYQLLRPRGLAVHFFPTLYAPPFVLNVLLSERLAEMVLHTVQSGRDRGGRHGKFPAYYSWCRGPTRSQIERFRRLGYSVEQYVGFFGHGGYYKKVPFVEYLHLQLADWLIRHPIPALTSFAWIVLRKGE